MALKLEGIFSPMATPLNQDGRVNKESTKNLVNFLVDNGVDGLLPLGTSGEFALLTKEERKVMLECVVDATNGRIPIVAGVSDPSSENVIQFAKDAKDVGADAVIATPPYYFSTTEEGLYSHYKRLSLSIDLPLLVYNIPEWTGLFVPVNVVKRLAEEKLIVGMKYTQYDFLKLLQFLNACKGKIAIFTGSDALAYSNLEFGGSGGVIGVTNIMPAVASKVYDEFKKGNLGASKDAQLKLLPGIEAIGVGKFPSGLKYAMNSIGLDVGPAKDPLPDLTQEEKKQVKDYLAAAGFTL
ncbi:MAG: dihydrodipicolinate synthase family protein [Nitrososphaerales archaeon]